MCRRLIYLGCFVLVISLAAPSIVEGYDPTLIGWWKLDEASGIVAADSSGYGNNGTLVGDPQWVPGMIEGALELDGNGDYVNCGTNTVFQIQDQITMACWIRVAMFTTNWSTIISKGDDSYRLARSAETGNAIHMGMNGTTSSPYQWFDGTITVADGQWHHVAGVYNGANAMIYIDGVLDTTQAATGQINASNFELYIGENAGATGRFLNGLVDDVRIYNRALAQAEIQTVMLGTSGGLASRPNPGNEATDVPRDYVLAWRPGEYADKHNVYLGTIFDDVNEAGIDDPRDVLVSQDQDPNTYDSFDFAQGGLEFSQTYYWRVDEVNAPPNSDVVYKGDVWNFTVESFAYPISIGSITATASSSSTNQGPEKTVDGSGLTNDQHSTSSTAMWLSSASGPQPSWIQYEFDDIYKLHEMWVWNSNQSMEPVFGYGMKVVFIEYSVDGSNWTQLGDVHEFAQATGKNNYTHNTTIDFGGVFAKFVKITADSNWKGIFRQYGLSEVRFFYIPVIAWQPSPISDQNNVGLDAVLSWRAGRDATVHQVYLSSDREAVENSTALAGTVNRIRFPLSPLGLELTKTYYWKVDEVNEVDVNASWEGDIWSFVTADYVTVDDFERYEDVCNRIFYTWLDGYGHSGDSACGVEPYEGNSTGSAVGNFSVPFAERGIVHEGRQSMPFEYNNSFGSFYSETQREWVPEGDWTRGGAKRLVLWFYGSPANSLQPLYVAVEDSAGTVKIAVHDNPDSLRTEDWQEWSIPLTSFDGVDLSSVKKMYIGVGDRNAPVVDGTGKLYFDDIRLYP